MTTSGTTAFSLTARDIAHEALWEGRVIPNGQDMTADELARVFFRLNAMLKTWQAQGMLWKQETYSASGTADTATIALPAYARGVTGCAYVESATNERTMGRWERDEYQTLPNKSASGTPTIFYADRGAGAVTLYVWPVPTANFTLAVEIDRAMDTVTDGNETIDIPEEWTEALMTNLALRCWGLFHSAPPPQMLVSQAAMLERAMSDAWRPASYTLGGY